MKRHHDHQLPFVEFVALMAMMVSLVALSVDAMLPALPAIGSDLGAADVNDAQLVVAALFLGFGFGQLIYGPISDSSGRKPAMYLGFALFLIGSVVCVLSSTLPVMLAGRVVQGIGLGAPRTLSSAIVRDQFQGRAMARVMSFVMTVFILVPMAAPLLGQGIMLIAGWRAIFVVILVFALLVVVWFGVRQPETLGVEQRAPFSIGRIFRAIIEVVSHRASLGYTIAAGLVFSPFLGYLSSAQQVLQVQYGLGERFPLYFAALAFAIGTASFVNARLVMRHGMRRLCTISLVTMTLIAVAAIVVAMSFDGHPPLLWLMAYLAATLFCLGTLFGNLNALAMEPLGHIAGVGASVVGALASFISVPLGALIGQSYDGTVRPLIVGFAVFGALALALMRWVQAGRSSA